jgi:prepilin-type N-terminal cleavage/methylation domain-containing protein
MVYHKCNKNKGFTLIEIIVVLGILILFLTITDAVYLKVSASSNLKIGADSLVESIRYAETNSQVAKNDSKWGVKIISNGVIIFKGNDYLFRDQSFDQFFNFPIGVTSSGLNEIVFEKNTGFTTNIGDIYILNDYGEQKLTLNYYGVINYGDLKQNAEIFSTPLVSSNTATLITDTTATLGANVTSFGIPASISERGICYGTIPVPTDCLPQGETILGIFTQNITGLIAGTTYYYRGYATNSTGIAYSDDSLFTTLSYPIPMSKWSFNEGIGCSANDSYGSNNGILKNDCPSISPSWIVGKIGNALSFNGSSNNILVYDSVNLNFTTSMSVSAWIKWNINPSTGAAYATIVNKNGDSQYRLQHNATNSRFEFGIRTNAGDRYATSTTIPVVGVWYHLVGTWDGTLVKIYINGVLEQTVSRAGTIVASTSPFKIGSSSLDARWFNGIIDEVMVWNRALDQQEINQIYSSNL